MSKNTWVVVTFAGALVASGCASKKYVSKEVGAVNQKVETLSDSVERNQERIGRNEESLKRQGGELQKVDAKADEAGQLAASAHDEAERAFNEAQRAMKGKLLYEITLSNDKVNFAFNASKLAPDAQMLVDELAELERPADVKNPDGHAGGVAEQSFEDAPAAASPRACDNRMLRTLAEAPAEPGEAMVATEEATNAESAPVEAFVELARK